LTILTAGAGERFAVDKPITRERVGGSLRFVENGAASTQNEQTARKKRRNEQFLQLLQR
jgi:hypothetical protein